jgi:hypothetical protein
VLEFQLRVGAGMSELKPYMIYSRGLGKENGAALVFAKTAKEAKKVGWSGIGSSLTDEYIDLGVRLMKEEDFLFEQADQKKLNFGIAHVIDNPKFCVMCEMWGISQLDENGLCENCRDLLEVKA